MVASINKNNIGNSRVNFFNPLKKDNRDLPLLLYLPGMDGTGKLFYNQISDLKPYFNLRCLTIAPDDLSNWQQLTQATLETLDRELKRVDFKKVYLCGESFGGCLAMSVAIAAPQLFSGMILVNAASSFNEQPILSWGSNFISWMPEWIHSNSALGLLPFLAELNRMTRSNRRALLNAMKGLPQEVVSWRLSLLRDFTFSPPENKRFKQPTLFIASGCDRLLPSVREASRLMNWFPHSQLEILPDSGHACLLESETNLALILQNNRFFSQLLDRKS